MVIFCICLEKNGGKISEKNCNAIRAELKNIAEDLIKDVRAEELQIVDISCEQIKKMLPQLKTSVKNLQPIVSKIREYRKFSLSFPKLRFILSHNAILFVVLQRET